MVVSINGREYNLNPVALLRRALLALFYEKVSYRDKETKKKATKYKFSPGRVFKIWLAVGFSLFMFEEGIQMFMFSTFPLQEVRDYERMVDRADSIVFWSRVGRFVNYAIGWTNPVMLVAYISIWDAGEAYADSLYVLAEVNGSIGQNVSIRPMVGGTGTTVPDVMKTNITSTAGDVDPVDFSRLSTIVIGPPTWSEPPMKDDPNVVIIDRIGPVPELLNMVGFRKTVVVPITSIDPRAAVINAKSPWLFNITAFPRNAFCYEILKHVMNYWIVINGEIGQYNGAPQMILQNPNDILLVKSMNPDGVEIPFDEFYKTITGGGQ